MKVEDLPLDGLKRITPDRFGDQRGGFQENWRDDRYRAHGIPASAAETFVQDNWSRSVQGSLRGLHYQWPEPQGKLVQVVRGRVFDVAVDIRRGAASFGRWHGVVLDDRACHQLYLPPGFAHGFLVLSAEADFLYKCTAAYAPDCEAGIAWNDPGLAIAWPDCAAPIVCSERDRAWPRLDQIPPEALPDLGTG